MIQDRRESGIVTDRDVVRAYLSYNSVDKVLKKGVPVSFAECHRILDAWGIVKGVSGRNGANWHEVGEFFLSLITASREKSRVTLESVYTDIQKEKIKGHSYSPVEVSRSTLHRAFSATVNRTSTNQAAIIFAHKQDSADQVLIGQDQTIQRKNHGVIFYPWTLPAVRSWKGESIYNSKLRVWQHEILSDVALDKQLGIGSQLADMIVEQTGAPIFSVNLLGTHVDIYRAEIPSWLSDRISSCRLKDMQFIDVHAIADTDPIHSPYRAGFSEVAGMYAQYLQGNLFNNHTTELRSNQKVCEVMGL